MAKALDKAGFQTGGYITKKGTPQGESAMFNKLPPGMNIDNQLVKDIRAMPYKEIVSASGYAGDGWSGSSASPDSVGSMEGE